jgi:hypothetical protein
MDVITLKLSKIHNYMLLIMKKLLMFCCGNIIYKWDSYLYVIMEYEEKTLSRKEGLFLKSYSKMISEMMFRRNVNMQLTILF